MSLEELRNDIIISQKKGLPFIITAVIIWLMISIVASLNINIMTKNILVFVCSCLLVPTAWLVGKKLKIDIFSKDNPLTNLGMLFTMNQMLYILIVMWVFNAIPEKMIMVYAMVFGAHMLPYSWLYKSHVYRNFAVIIPVIALILGNIFNGFIVALTLTVIEIIFVVTLIKEMKRIK
ncbi:DUF7010 family protein [Peptostreptococcus equinus]|uniref:Uncharacterized protein n=1 Tax=Peptostreptococcus equinus TaxID=3003601 RepID=A0ABY7JSB0_9FIRM|nr:hypothetical protein [Peptostreptococcus sp. CBA3647]WAW15376.1 hypothetical protein O0R46_02720 [Peptostreptococcus sp. CBA3647]